MKIIAKSLSKDGFLPYGFALRPRNSPFKYDEPQFWDRIPLELVDGGAELVFASIKHHGFTCTTMERHMKVSQGFVVLDGEGILVVAPPAQVDSDGHPNVNLAHAFFVESQTSFVLHTGTWHSALFPISEKVDYVLVTRRETTDDSIHPFNGGDVQIRELMQSVTLTYNIY